VRQREAGLRRPSRVRAGGKLASRGGRAREAGKGKSEGFFFFSCESRASCPLKFERHSGPPCAVAARTWRAGNARESSSDRCVTPAPRSYRRTDCMSLHGGSASSWKRVQAAQRAAHEVLARTPFIPALPPHCREWGSPISSATCSATSVDRTAIAGIPIVSTPAAAPGPWAGREPNHRKNVTTTRHERGLVEGLVRFHNDPPEEIVARTPRRQSVPQPRAWLHRDARF
jgi:hypothetical protein